MPEQNAHLSNIEVNHMVGLMSDVGPETLPHNAVPARRVHNIEFRFDELRDIFFNSELLEGSRRTVNSMLRHP